MGRSSTRSSRGINYQSANARVATIADPLGDLLFRPSGPQPFSIGEDRRSYYPTPYATSWRPATVVSGRPARLSAPKPSRPSRLSWVPPQVAFASPSRTWVCIRRKMRREVLHAFGRAGRRVARPRYSVYSSVSCK